MLKAMVSRKGGGRPYKIATGNGINGTTRDESQSCSKGIILLDGKICGYGADAFYCPLSRTKAVYHWAAVIAHP